jgi:DNA polymerase I-like protein with 3'-5' exonuclease and polymerase domains
VKDYNKRIEENNETTIHPTIRLDKTRSGRTSCENPNVQNVPNKFGYKAIFTSRFEDGYIGLVDFSKAEINIAAYMSDVYEYALDCTKRDVYQSFASRIYNLPEEQTEVHIEMLLKWLYWLFSMEQVLIVCICNPKQARLH